MDRERIYRWKLWRNLPAWSRTGLAAIIAKRTPAAFLDEVCNLAECLGTTVRALLQTPDDQEADGWN